MSNIPAKNDGGENYIRRTGGRRRLAQMAALGVSCREPPYLSQTSAARS
jgi:hypothetical protein